MIFTRPQVGKVGLTEAAACSQELAVESSVLPLLAVPRALANHDTQGLLKLVVERGTRRLLGVHIVAENAGDLIHTATLGIAHGLTAADLSATLALYLTMAEGLKPAAQSFGQDVRKLSCCASWRLPGESGRPPGDLLVTALVVTRYPPILTPGFLPV